MFVIRRCHNNLGAIFAMMEGNHHRIGFFTDVLDDATKFASVSDAIVAIQNEAFYYGVGSEDRKYLETLEIVEIEEVNTPTYTIKRVL